MQSRDKKKKGPAHVAILGILLALALILGYVESLLPLPFGVPGMKIGLSNLIVLFALYRYGWLEAGSLSLAKITLSCLLFSGGMAFLYSLAGGACSFFGMVLLKKTGRFGVLPVSTIGGVLHNLGQLLVAFLFIPSFNLLYYLPILLLFGAAAGFVVGLTTQELLIRLPKRN